MTDRGDMDREICKGGWLQQKIQAKQSKKKEPGYQEWVVFCVHNQRIPLLEVFAGQGDVNFHCPIKVTDLLECSYISSQIDDDRSFSIGFKDPSRANLDYTAPSPQEKNEWITMLTYKLNQIGCLDDGKNLYSPLPFHQQSSATSQYEFLAEASSASASLTVAPDSDEMGGSSSALSTAPELHSPAQSSDHRDQNGNLQVDDLYERICEGPRSNSTLPAARSPRFARGRQDLPAPLPTRTSSARVVPSYSEIVPKAQRALIAAQDSEDKPPSSAPPPIPPRVNNVGKKPISLDSTVPAPSFTGRTVVDSRYKRIPPTAGLNEDVSYSVLPPAHNGGFASASGYDTLSSIRGNSGYTDVASNNNSNHPRMTSEERVSDEEERRGQSPLNSDRATQASGYQQLSASPSSRPVPETNGSQYQTLSFPIPISSHAEPAIYQHYVQLPSQPRPVPTEELLRLEVQPSPSRSPTEIDIAMASPSRSERSVPTASRSNSHQSEDRASVSRQSGRSHASVSSEPPPPLPPRNPDNSDLPASLPPPASPVQATKKLSLKELEVDRLRKEIEGQKSIQIKLSLSDAQEALAVVAMDEKIWVAGWLPKYNKRLSVGFHIGDRITRINEAEIKSFHDYNLALKTSTPSVNFVIKRVPNGQIKLFKRELTGESLGIVLKRGKNTIESIVPGSLADRTGLQPKGKGFRSHTEDVPYVITEVNNRPLNLFSTNGDTKKRLDAVGSDITILIQPKDFIKPLKEHLKSRKSWKDFLLG